MNKALTDDVRRTAVIQEETMKKFIAIVLCALCLSACGKRGKLDFPEGATYPRQYPAARQPGRGGMKRIDAPAAEQKPAEDAATDLTEQNK